MQMQSGMSASELKAREHDTWAQVAPGWRKHDERLVGSAAVVTERMLARMALKPGARVLDIASGTGEPALSAAERVAPGGRVLGTDFVDEMLAFAREKAARRGLTNVEFRLVDGEQLEVPDGTIDAVSCRWGLMFMPEPVECLRRAYRAMKPGGRLAAACWAGPERNGWLSVPMSIIRRRLNVPAPPPGSPGVFAFGDGARLKALLESAGFQRVEVEPVEVTMVDFDSPKEYFGFLLDLAGPVAALFDQLSAAEQGEVAAEIIAAVTGPDGRVVLDGMTWVASGAK